MVNLVKAIDINGNEVEFISIACYDRKLSKIISIQNDVESLWIWNNELISLPSELPTNLISLSCSNNKLTSLPTLPTSLLVLICHNNKIKKLPDLRPCKKLQYVTCDLITFEPYMLDMKDVEFEFHC